MAPDAQQDPTITELNALVSSVAALLTQLEATLTGLTKETEASKVSASSSSEPVVAAGTGNTQIDCLKLAADSADLIRAHTTRLSLLIITEPFTPTAIGKVLRELVSGAVPSLATAAELCDGERFTYFFSQAMRVKCHSLMRELRAFVQKIPSDGKVLTEEQKNAATDGSQKGSLAMTGVLWSICDDLKRFATGGVGPYLVKRIEETRLTLKDIVEELTEWQEESEEQDDDDDDDDEDGGNAADFDSAVDINDSRANSMQAQGLHDNAQELLDDLMGSAKTIPRDDPQKVRPRLAQFLRSLKLCMIMCQAVSKRRLKTLPALPAENGEITASLQRVFTFLNTLPQKYEDVVLAFYDLDTATVDENLKKAGVGLIGAIEPLKTPFNEQDSDEFTTWFGKFKTELETAYSSQY